MDRFEIILPPERPDSGNVVQLSPGRFSRFKTKLAAFLVVAALAGLVIAVLVVGSIIAAVILVLVVLAVVYVAIKIALRKIRSQRTS